MIATLINALTFASIAIVALAFPLCGVLTIWGVVGEARGWWK